MQRNTQHLCRYRNRLRIHQLMERQQASSVLLDPKVKFFTAGAWQIGVDWVDWNSYRLNLDPLGDAHWRVLNNTCQ